MAQRSSSRKPRSSGASRRGGSKKGSGVPGWVWLVTGVLAGLFAAFLIFLVRFDAPVTAPAADTGKRASETKSHSTKERAPAAATASKRPAEKPAAKVEVASTKPAPSKKPTEQAEKQPEKPAVNYDFYKILPQYEVVVSEEEASKPATTTNPGTYYLQVGAFRKMEEADGRKAELALLGFVTSIQTVTVDKDNTWHRLRIGPVKDMRQLDRTKRQLQDHNIAFVTLREKN